MKGKFGAKNDTKSQGKDQKTRKNQTSSKQKVVNSSQKEKKSFAKKGSGKQSTSLVTTAKCTPIKDVTPLISNISVKGRIISVWHGHKLNKAHEPYSLECIFQDEEGHRIQIYVKKDFMFQFEPLLRDGVCYLLSHFGVIENSGRWPMLPHKWTLSFFKNTNVTRIDDTDDNVNGFIPEPFSRINDPDEEYAENNCVDVIGTVVGIGQTVAVNSTGTKKIRRTIHLENEEGEKVELTFWDAWTKKWDEYAKKMNTIGYIDVMMILGKVKYFNNVPAIHNNIFGTKLFINQNFPELVAFRKRYESRDEYDSNKHKIELVNDEMRVVTPQKFMQGAVKKLVGSIRDTVPDTECVIYAKVHSIQYDSGWTYKGCKQCSTKVVPNASSGPSSSKAKKKPWWCPKHNEAQESFAYRYKMIIRVVDDESTAQLCVFDGSMHRMSGYTAWELVEKYGADTTTYFPHEELDAIIGKHFLFRIQFSEYNHNNNSHVYRCEKVTSDVEIVDYWKQGFVGDQLVEDDSEHESENDSESEGEDETEGDAEMESEGGAEDDMEEDVEHEVTTPSVPIKTGKQLDLSLGRRLQLQTPTSHSSGDQSGHTSGSGKKRQRTIERPAVVVINLSDSEYDTDPEQDEVNAKKQLVAVDPKMKHHNALVTVKKEKDDDLNGEKDEATK